MADWSDFPWRPGMRVLPDEANRGARMVLGEDYRWVFAVEAGIETTRDGGPCIEAWSDDAIDGEEVPDLTDPATVGALAGAVREAYCDPLIHAAPGAGAWCVYRTVVDNVIGCERLDVLLVDGAWTGIKDDETCAAPIRCATEGEAWLAAWHARPKGGA